MKLIVLLLLALLTGCRIVATVAPVSPGDVSQTVVALTNMPETVAPTAEVEHPVDGCLQRDPNLILPPSSYVDYPQTIGKFLSQGGILENLDQGLYQAGMLGQPIGIQAGDFDKNGAVDVAVVLINPASAPVTPDGRLLVYLCQDGAYLLHEIHPPSEEDYRTPILKFNQDLNGDAQPELVAGFGSCGAHTCFESLGIYSWQNGGFANLLSGSTGDLPYPSVSLEGPDSQGFYAIKISASGFGSVGAGPQREIIRVYTYDPGLNQWVLFAEKTGSSTYRVHALHDAEDLAAAEKFPEALVLYQQVISNDALLEWQDPQTERANLAAYARYKMIALYTLLGREEIAQAALAEFETAVPPGSSQTGYLDMARIFRREGGFENRARACTAVQAYADKHSEQILAPLGTLAFGYVNRELTAQDTCPWK